MDKIVTYCIPIFSYVLLCSAVILTVTMGSAFSLFRSDVIIYTAKLNYRILYGFGIGVGILCFVGFAVFLLLPSLKAVSFIVFPVFFIFSLIVLIVNLPHSAQRFVDSWGSAWSPSLETEAFQMQQRCCGWRSEADRGLERCPLRFVSGCADVLLRQLKPRFSEVMAAMIVVLALGLVSGFVLFAIYSSEKKLITALPVFT